MEQTVENQKKPVGRKIASIVLICVASLLVVMMVLCYVIPKNYAPEIATPDYIQVHTSNSDGLKYDKGTEVYNKIMSLYNDSFKVTIMDSLLTGNLAEKGEYVDTPSLNYPKNSNTNYIEFKYNAEKTVKNYTYYSIIVGVANTKELSKTDIYFVTNSGSSSSRIKFQTYAHQSALYEYILSI